MDEEKIPFAFEKKLGIADCLYGDIPALLMGIEKLLYCMKETNKMHNVECEFFRLDFRPRYIYEQPNFPIGSLILDMKWGSQQELKKNKKEKQND